jgi:predicted MFS family arabinose efflux permease
MIAEAPFKPSARLYLGSFVTMADRFSVAPMLIPISMSLHVPLAAATWAATLYYLAYGLMPPVHGMLADRFGRVRIIRGALVGVAVADLLSAASPNLATLLVARFATGALASGVFPITLVYLGDRFAFTLRQRAIVGLQVWVAIGTAAGTLAAGLIAHFFSWRVFFLIPAVLAALTALLLRRLPESLTHQRGSGPVHQIGRVLAHRWALLLFGMLLVEGAVMLGFVTFLAPALEAHGQSAAIAGVVVASYGLAVLASTQVFNGIARRTPAPVVLAGGAVMLCAGFTIAAIDQGIIPILAASLLAGGAYVFMHSTFQTWATDVVPEARGTATALAAMAIFFGAAIATSGAAGLANAHNYRALFIVGAALTVPVLVVGTLARARYSGSGMDVAIELTP